MLGLAADGTTRDYNHPTAVLSSSVGGSVTVTTGTSSLMAASSNLASQTVRFVGANNAMLASEFPIAGTHAISFNNDMGAFIASSTQGADVCFEGDRTVVIGTELESGPALHRLGPQNSLLSSRARFATIGLDTRDFVRLSMISSDMFGFAQFVVDAGTVNNFAMISSIGNQGASGSLPDGVVRFNGGNQNAMIATTFSNAETNFNAENAVVIACNPQADYTLSGAQTALLASQGRDCTVANTLYTDNFDFSGTLTAGGSVGAAGQVLTSNGAGLAPTWQATAGGATLATLSGGSENGVVYGGAGGSTHTAVVGGVGVRALTSDSGAAPVFTRTTDLAVNLSNMINAADRDEHTGRHWDRLRAAGGEIRLKQNNPELYQLMHHKLVIVDGRVLINGSGNWSGSGFFFINLKTCW